MMRTLGYINSAITTTGTRHGETSDPLLISYVWQSPGNQCEHQPAFRIDYNLSTSIGSPAPATGRQWCAIPDQLNAGDVRFPGAPNYSRYNSTPADLFTSLRSTLGANMVNEMRGGITARRRVVLRRRDVSNGVPTFADQGGYALDFDSNIGLTNWFTANGPTCASARTWSVDEPSTCRRGGTA